MGVVERPPSAHAYAEPFFSVRGSNLAREALRNLRRQHAYLLSNLPGVVYRCDVVLPWRMLFVSRKVAELTGRRREAFENGLGWEEIIHPEDLPIRVGVVEAALDGLQEFTAVYRMLHASGSTKWVREQAQVVRGEDHRIYLEGFIQDITQERHLAESANAAEEASNQKARALEEVLESTNDCVYSLNSDWRITYVNARAQEYFGGIDSVLGKPILEVFTDQHSPFETALTRAMNQRERNTIEGFLESRQSWYELTAAPSPGGITVFFRDTTEQQKLRDHERANATRWKATLNAIPQMVWSMAGGGRRPDFYNERWYEFTGLPAGSVTGPEWADLFHPDDRENTLSSWRRCRDSGESYEVEYRVRDRSGNYRWVVSRGHSELDEQGAVVRWYGTCTDIHERRLDRLALEASERRTKDILNSIPQIIWCADESGNLDFISSQWAKGSDVVSEGVLGQGWLESVHPDDRDSAKAQWAARVQDGKLYEAAFRVLQPNGKYLWTLIRARPEKDEAGKVVRWFGTCTDIHEQITTQQALEESEQLNRGIVQANPDCMSVLDADGRVLYVNSATANAYGAEDVESIVGSSWGSAFTDPVASKAMEALEVARQGGIGRLILRGGVSGDRWFDVAVAPIIYSGGAARNFLVSSRDFTDRKLAEEKAQWAANHDSLTELPNRFLFHKRMEEEIRNNEEASGFALLIFDVDYLKNVNDGMGHDAGDALLREVAKRLVAAVGPHDIVARLGGDEFGVLLTRVLDRCAVEEIARSIRERLAAPFTYSGRLVDCQGSIGASLFPLHSRERSELMKCADVALYAAKQSSKGHLRIYEPAMRDQAQRRLSMLSLARSALRNKTIAPFYQPKISLTSGSVSGFEALLRWRDHADRVHPPRSISAAFDDLELASQISDRMMEAVVDDVEKWLDGAVPFGHIALNAGSVELRRQDFVDLLLERLVSKRIPTEKIQLEVTETVFLGRGSEHIEKALRTLSSEGVKLALDDFGTGYASLSHLNKYPVDYIKIDRSFVQDIQTGKGGEAIVDAVLGLGQSLGIEIIAEGIEDLEQHRFLTERDCQFAQGFLYSKAVPAEEVPRLVETFSKHRIEVLIGTAGSTEWPRKIGAG